MSVRLTPSTELTTCQELAKYTALVDRDPDDVLNSSVEKINNDGDDFRTTRHNHVNF